MKKIIEKLERLIGAKIISYTETTFVSTGVNPEYTENTAVTGTSCESMGSPFVPQRRALS